MRQHVDGRTESVARVAVVGAGAIGGYLAATAYAAGHDVTLCARTPLKGLRVSGGGRTLEAPVRVVTDPRAAPGDVEWILLATKAQDTPGAAGWLGALAGPGTVTAVLQNGVEHLALAGPLVPPGAEVLPVLVYVSVERVGAGHVVHHTGDRLVVPDCSPAAEGFARLWAGTGVEVVREAEFTTAAWRKLLTNLAANPLTALLRQRMEVFAVPEMVRLAEDVLREGVAVARAEGAGVGDEDIARTLRTYAAGPPDGGTSMLYDRLAGRPMEHEHITGAVVRAGERHGVPTPLNRMLLTLLRVIDRQV